MLTYNLNILNSVNFSLTVSSESALSSDGSEGSCSEGSLGIALRLRPTLPKKQRAVPRFSPAAAWRQLASLDDHLAAGNFISNIPLNYTEPNNGVLLHFFDGHLFSRPIK